jgi:hypothetical protein
VRVFYAADCDCSDLTIRAYGFEPEYLAAGPGQEREAARRHLKSVEAEKRGAGPRYFAYHVGGRHIIHVIED